MKVAVFFLIVMAATVLLTFSLPRVYLSESILMVRLGRENVALDPTATLGQAPVVAIPRSRENDINSVAEILRSRALIEQVVDAIGPATILNRRRVDGAGNAAQAGLSDDEKVHSPWLVRCGLSPSLDQRDVATGKLQNHLHVKPMEETNVLRISCKSHSPEVAQAVAAKLVEVYLAEHARLHRTPRAHEFLTSQTARLRADVTAAEEKLSEVKSHTGLIDVDQQRVALVARISRIEDELLQVDADMAATDAEVKQLKKDLATLSDTEVTAETSGMANTALDGMRQQLYALQLQELEFRERYTDQHFKMLQIREEIEAARTILAQEEAKRTEVTRGPNRAFEATRLTLLTKNSQLSSMRAKADALRSQLVVTRSEFDAFTEDELQIASLRREVDLHDSNYRRYASNLEQARIDHMLELEKISNIVVVQPASFDPKPIQPPVLLCLVGGFVLALFSGIGAALSAEQLDRSLKTPDEIEKKLDLPTLVCIPCLKREELIFSGRN